MHLLRNAIALLALAAAPAAGHACTDVREGTFLAFDLSTGQFFATCWPINFTPATVFQFEDGTPTTVQALDSTNVIRATGCLQADGFTLDAETVVVLGSSPALPKASDVQVVLGNTGMSAWFVSATSAPSLAPTGSGNPNPAMTLELGKRYSFAYSNFAGHPLAFIAAGATPAGDTLVLVTGATTGSMEANLDVAWEDTGTQCSFTVTPQLFAALEGTSSQTPGYRCNFHTATMRGSVAVVVASSVTAWEQYD